MLERDTSGVNQTENEVEVRELIFECQRLVIASDAEQVAQSLAEKWLLTARTCIAQRGRFCSAITGGSTPAAIYRHIAHLATGERLDWSRVYLIWTDERDVPLSHPDSNYHMAMQNGLGTLPIPQDQIHPMQFGVCATKELDGQRYSDFCEKLVGSDGQMDWTFLGLGEDGHTASLFPGSPGFETLPKLRSQIKAETYSLAVSHFIPSKQMWRMSLTLPFLNGSARKIGCVLGKGKGAILAKVTAHPRDVEPASWLGSEGSSMNWYVDEATTSQMPPLPA